MSLTRRHFLTVSAVAGLALPSSVLAASSESSSGTRAAEPAADSAADSAKPAAEPAVSADNSADNSGLPMVSRHLDEVLALLNDEIVGKNVKPDGATPLERQTALLDYFRGRNVPSTYELFYQQKPETIVNRGGSGKFNARQLAELALEHTFPGQPAYAPSFRGRETIDWDTNPYKDKEWIWQFHRFNWLCALASEYARTKDEKYSQEWTFEMRSWIDWMHRPENAFGHPGWRSLDTAIRMKTWACYLEFFLKSPALDGALLVDLIYSLDVHCKLIEKRCQSANQRQGALGNWDVFHAEGLLFTAAALPERKTSVEEIRLAAQSFAHFQKRVLLDDGVINEYIPSYHSAYPGQFARLTNVCQKLNLPVEFSQEYRDLLEKSINAMVVWSHPDGTSPVFGDAWLGGRDANRRWIAPFLERYDRPDWVWFASNGKQGTPPESRLQELPTAGYYTMRSDWTDQALFLVVKNSNTTRFGHNQADNMTFELSAFGQRLMSDSGCYNYSGEPEWRQFFRSPIAHQLVSLDDKPILSRGQKLESRSAPASADHPPLDILKLKNEPTDGLIHCRTFFLVDKRFFVIIDDLSGPASGELRQRFQFLPGSWSLNKEKLTAFTQHAQAPNLILAEAKPNAESEPISVVEEEGWISSVYMKKEQRPAIAFVQRKQANESRRFATLLYPVAPSENAAEQIVDITVDPEENVIVHIGSEVLRWSCGL